MLGNLINVKTLNITVSKKNNTVIFLYAIEVYKTVDNIVWNIIKDAYQTKEISLSDKARVMREFRELKIDDKVYISFSNEEEKEEEYIILGKTSDKIKNEILEKIIFPRL